MNRFLLLLVLAFAGCAPERAELVSGDGAGCTVAPRPPEGVAVVWSGGQFCQAGHPHAWTNTWHLDCRACALELGGLVDRVSLARGRQVMQAADSVLSPLEKRVTALEAAIAAINSEGGKR